MKNTKWITFFIILIVVCFFALFIMQNSKSGSKIAQVSQDGTVIKEIDLEAVEAPYEFTVSDGNGGHNTIRVEKGKIAVVSADCPDRICVKQGFIQTGVNPIVCLPHKLSITIVSKDNIDAVAGMQ